MLDVETFEWTKLDPGGNPLVMPDSRGGHTATIMADKP
jgi:hypothetical protein